MNKPFKDFESNKHAFNKNSCSFSIHSSHLFEGGAQSSIVAALPVSHCPSSSDFNESNIIIKNRYKAFKIFIK
jgi:hypothetical protein